MNDIELLKKRLNAEKVFSHFDLEHRLLSLSKDSIDDNIDFNNNTLELDFCVSCIQKKKKKYEKHFSHNHIRDDGISDINEEKKELKNKLNGTNKNNENISKNNSNNLLNYLCCMFNIGSRTTKINEKIIKCKYVKEIKTDTNFKIDFNPPVDVLYNEEKVIFLFNIPGNIEKFNVFSDSNLLEISGFKELDDNFNEEEYLISEINTGYFKRSYLFDKPINKQNIYHEQKDGIFKIVVNFEKEKSYEE